MLVGLICNRTTGCGISNRYLATVAKQQYWCMLQGICYYGNTVCQIGHVFSIESLHTISVNQIGISDFF